MQVREAFAFSVAYHAVRREPTRLNAVATQFPRSSHAVFQPHFLALKVERDAQVSVAPEMRVGRRLICSFP